MEAPTPAPGLPATRRRRRWGRYLLLVCALVALLIPLSSPLWLPWVLPTGLQWWGVTVSSCERLGWGRMLVHDAHYSNPRVTVQAARIEVLHPIVYLVRRLDSAPVPNARPGLLVSDWTVTVAPARTPAGPAPGSTAVLLDTIEAILGHCRKHLPAARLERGRLVAGNQAVELREVAWDRERLEVVGEYRGNNLTVALRAEATSSLRIQAAGQIGSVDLRLQSLAPGRWAATGSARTFGNTIDLEATFGTEGWFPAEAVAKIEHLLWPDSLARKPHALASVSGSAVVRWRGGQGELEAALESALVLPAAVIPQWGNAAPIRWGEAAPSRTQPFPITANIRAKFDLTQAEVTQLSITSRLAQATLAGTLRMAPWGGNEIPAFDLRIDADGVRVDDSPEGSISLQASFAWPIVRLESCSAQWPQCQLQAGGEFDFVTQEFRNGRWQLDGAPPLPHPAVSVLRALQARGTVEGPLTAPRHATELAVEGIAAGLRERLSVTSAFRGVGTNLEGFEAVIDAGPLKLVLGGSASLGGSSPGNALIELTRLDWRRGDLERMRLRQPTQLRWHLHSGTPTGPAYSASRFELTPLSLEGSGSLIQVSGAADWPDKGALRLELIRPPLDDLATVIRDIPDWLAVESLHAQVGWTNGPVSAQARTAVILQLNREERARLDSDLELTPDRLTANVAIAKETGEPLARSEIAIPVGLEFDGSKGRTRVDPEGPVQATLTAASNPALWYPIASRIGVSVEDPFLEVALTGNLRRLRGDIQLGASSLAVNRMVGGRPAPPIEDLKARIVMDESGAMRAEIDAGAAGQRARAVLEWPLPPLDLEHLANLRTPDWSDARGKVRLSRWQIGALLPWIPGLLTPEGEVDAEITLEPGRQLAGTFSVTNAETLALPGLGPLRQIQLTGELRPEGVKVTEGSADLAGSSVNFSGSYTFATNVAPRMRFDFAGTNLTLIRNADVVLRGDAKVSLTGTTLEDTEIAGDLRFHDSLLLRDLQTLVGGRTQTPENRPPWFSIRQGPFASWRLNVRVTGDRFLRVVTPLFRGWASTSLALAGTLREPLLLGDLTVPEGRLTFPFGSLSVTQARASLTREDPHRPRLQVKASGRNFGYDLRLDISGPADAMNLVFGSVPPLSSTQVLLMLTTGEVPSEAYSYSATRRLQTIGMFLGKEFLGQLAGDPGAERLTLRTGEDVTHRGQLTYRVEYRLTPRWSLFGTQDRFDSYQGGVIYTLYAK